MIDEYSSSELRSDNVPIPEERLIKLLSILMSISFKYGNFIFVPEWV